MESNRNIDGVTERYVVTLEQRDAERSRSRRRRNDETTERADSRRSAQRERKQRRRYLETVEPRPLLSRPMLGVLLIAVGLNVVHRRNFAEYVGRAGTTRLGYSCAAGVIGQQLLQRLSVDTVTQTVMFVCVY